jgi:hypothetical protein
MSLRGPSKTVVVEPLETPAREPERVGADDEPPPAPAPAPAAPPAREPATA